MKKFLLLLLPLFFAGCMNIDYVGKKFKPVSDTGFTADIKEISLDDYTLIGRFTVDARPMYHPYEVEEAVLEKSREYGGDILCMTDAGMDVFSVYTTNSQEFGAPKPEKRKITPEEKALFGNIVPLESEKFSTPRRVFRFLLFKKTSELNRQLGY